MHTLWRALHGLALEHSALSVPSPNCRMQRSVYDKVPFETTAAGR